MRIILAAGILFICCICSAQAQRSAPAHRFAVGIKVGPTFSKITRTVGQTTLESFNPALTQGVSGGLSIQYFTETHFALQLEILYMQKGWRQILYDNDEERKDRFITTLNYLEVPVMAHGYIGKKNVRIFLDGGIYLAYLFSYNSFKDPNVDEDEIVYKINNGNANQVDLGIKGGGGFEVATKAGTFQLGASYAWGVGSVIKKYQTTPANAARGIPNMLQNSAFAITLGYYVEFGKSKEK